MLDMFNGSSQKLPLPTIVLMFPCNQVRNPYVQIGFVLGVVYYGIYFRDYVRTPEGKFNYDRLKVKLPGLGPLNKKLNHRALLPHLWACSSPRASPLTKALEVLMEFLDNEYVKQLCCMPIYTGVREGTRTSPR